MGITSRYIILLRITDHEMEVGLKLKTVFIHPFLHLRAYGTKVHWTFDHVKIAAEKVR